MKTFNLTFELVAAVTVEQEENLLNDPAIIKTIPISELSTEEIDSIKRYIENNLSWTFSEAIDMQPITILQNGNMFMVKVRVATDDIEKAISELAKFYEISFDGKWVNSDRDIRIVPSPEQYDNEEITYNLDLTLKSLDYQQGEDIDKSYWPRQNIIVLQHPTLNLTSFEEVSQMLSRNEIVKYIIDPSLQIWVGGISLPGISDRILTLFDRSGQTYLVKAKYDPQTHQIYPPI